MKEFTEVVQITRERYWDMLEVLPPQNWTRTATMEHFRMCEYNTGSLTEQFAQRGDVYINKEIDVDDQSTWIKASDFKGLVPMIEDALEEVK